MSAAYLGHAACHCHGRTVCGTCAGFNVIFDTVAARRADAVERAIEDRRTRLVLARHQATTRRRQVRYLPRRAPFDLDALADAVALRLRGQP